MKKLCYLFPLMALCGCSIQSRYITERYIKTTIEKHTPNEFSSIKLYSIYKSGTETGRYLEFTGYKYGKEKGLVIGADIYYLARQKFVGDFTKIAEVSYVVLTADECEAIVDNYNRIAQEQEEAKPKTSEEIYNDFTVNKNLFLSFRKSTTQGNSYYIDCWVAGEKYSISTTTLIKRLRRFLNW